MARCVLETGRTVRLLAENLGERGWRRQAWNPADHRRSCRGVTDTLAAAKASVELALLSGRAGRHGRDGWV